jgi:hypothetical protein
LNRASKSVFSGTLKTTDWANSAILSGDTTEEIEKLRREGTGELLNLRPDRTASAGT